MSMSEVQCAILDAPEYAGTGGRLLDRETRKRLQYAR
jgi:hypothetical protein